MENEKIVVGLDIGTTKICVIVGKQNQFGKLEILGMGKAVSEGVSRGVVVNIDKTMMAIEKAIKEASDQAQIDIGVVNVGIAGQHIRSTKHHGSIMRQNGNDEVITLEDINRLTNDMYKIVIPPGNEIIHVMPQDYTVDYEEGIKEPIGYTGVRLEADFHVITANTTNINNINKCVRRSNLAIESLILEPLASSLAVLSEEEKEAGVVLVDIGGGTTDVAIFYDGIIRHTAVIPFGGNIITQDIKEGLQVMTQQAEQLKSKFGKAIAKEASAQEIISIPGLRNREPKEISVKNLSYIIQARMEEIIQLVISEILMSGYQKKLAGGIVITGGGAQLQHLKQLFEYMSGLDTRIGHPNEHLGRSVVDTVKSPMYATTVGLVLAGFQALDDRENKYVERSQTVQANITPNKSDIKVTMGTTATNKSNFLKDILSKTKSMLIDDFDDKSNY